MNSSGPSRATDPDPAAVIELVRGWLSRTLASDAMGWVDGEIAHQRTGVDERRLALSLSLAARKIGRTGFSLSPAAIAEARALRAGWQPEKWGTDEAGRVAILLSTYRGDDQAFGARLETLCASAEVNELIAYLKGFAVFPAPKALYQRAREGVRSTITPVLEAIACRNPYPFDHFDEAAWNQMVVKCVFTGTSMETIFGLRERRSSELIKMLRDLISERNAAGRVLPNSVHSFVAENN